MLYNFIFKLLRLIFRIAFRVSVTPDNARFDQQKLLITPLKM